MFYNIIVISSTLQNVRVIFVLADQRIKTRSINDDRLEILTHIIAIICLLGKISNCRFMFRINDIFFFILHFKQLTDFGIIIRRS